MTRTTPSAIATDATDPQPADPIDAELQAIDHAAQAAMAWLGQWTAQGVQAIRQATDATLAELHQAFDAATVARDRKVEETSRQQRVQGVPQPKASILDAEVALVAELRDLVETASELHHATLEVEQDADAAIVGAMHTYRETERQTRRMMAARGLPAPDPTQEGLL